MVGLVYLFHGPDEAGVSEVQILGHGEVPVVTNGLRHYLVEGTVHDVDFFGSFDVKVICAVAYEIQEFDCALLLILLRHLAMRNVLQILEPLEVRAGDATTVCQQVRGNNYASFE